MSHTVLVCDDAVFMRTMLSDILQQAGFTIVGEADTGTKAVAKSASKTAVAGKPRDRRSARDNCVRSAGSRRHVQRNGSAGTRR